MTVWCDEVEGLAQAIEEWLKGKETEGKETKRYIGYSC